MTDNRVNPRILPPPLLYYIKGAVIRFRLCSASSQGAEIDLSTARLPAPMPGAFAKRNCPALSVPAKPQSRCNCGVFSCGSEFARTTNNQKTKTVRVGPY